MDFNRSNLMVVRIKIRKPNAADVPFRQFYIYNSPARAEAPRMAASDSLRAE